MSDKSDTPKLCDVATCRHITDMEMELAAANKARGEIGALKARIAELNCLIDSQERALREANANLHALRKELAEQEGYPGIAHDFEAAKAELKRCQEERDAAQRGLAQRQAALETADAIRKQLIDHRDAARKALREACGEIERAIKTEDELAAIEAGPLGGNVLKEALNLGAGMGLRVALLTLNAKRAALGDETPPSLDEQDVAARLASEGNAQNEARHE